MASILAYPPKFLLPESDVDPNSSPHPKAVFAIDRIIEDRLNEISTDPAVFDESENVFSHMLKSPTRATISEIRQEARGLCIAGSETVAGACTIACINILSSQTICAKLIEELLEIWPDLDVPVSFTKLEKLPYLVTCIFPLLEAVNLIEALDCHHKRKS